MQIVAFSSAAINSGSQSCPGGSSIISLIPTGLGLDRETIEGVLSLPLSLLSLGFHYNRIWAINSAMSSSARHLHVLELNKHLPDKTSKARAYNLRFVRSRMLWDALQAIQGVQGIQGIQPINPSASQTIPWFPYANRQVAHPSSSCLGVLLEYLLSGGVGLAIKCELYKSLPGPRIRLGQQ